MPITVATPPEVRGVAVALRALVRGALALEGGVPGEIAIVLADDARLRELNRRYRGTDRATDVLSFEYDESAMVGRPGTRHRRHSRRISGDIVISLDRVAEQARRYRVSRGEELARLVIHGALHLAGLDHHEARERLHMRAQEDRALRQVRSAAAALARALTPAARRPAAPAPPHSRSGARGRAAAAFATGRRRSR